jgi:Uma2 family endonuclease
MAGDTLDRYWRLSMATFHGFRDERPKEEKWELIDGRPVSNEPHTIIRRRISGNIERVLNSKLPTTNRLWQADQGISVLLPDDDRFNPSPDVTVIETAFEIGQIYVQRFYFVAEVLSGSDKAWVLEAKLDYYQKHEHCLAVMFLKQDQIAADLYLRAPTWTKSELADPVARLDIPGIGDIGALGDLYRNTPLSVSGAAR